MGPLIARTMRSECGLSIGPGILPCLICVTCLEPLFPHIQPLQPFVLAGSALPRMLRREPYFNRPKESILGLEFPG